MSSTQPNNDDFDPELDDILNDALNDFDLDSGKDTKKQQLSSPSQQQQQQQQRGNTSNHQDAQNDVSEEEMKELTQKMKDLMTNFNMNQEEGEIPSTEELLKDFSEDEKRIFGQISQQMEKMFTEDMQQFANEQQQENNSSNTRSTESTTTNTRQQEEKQQKDLDDIICETLDMLNKEPESWKDENLNTAASNSSSGAADANPDDMLKDMLKMFGGGGADGNDNTDSDEPMDEDKMYGLLENMMQTLMSPDILHEPMQKLVEHYPKWLDEKRGSVDAEEYEKVEKQFKYAKRICFVYENKKFPDSLEEIMELMKEMQECGQPPEEIVQAITSEGGEMPQIPPMPSGDGNGEPCPVQ